MLKVHQGSREIFLVLARGHQRELLREDLEVRVRVCVKVHVFITKDIEIALQASEEAPATNWYQIQ